MTGDRMERVPDPGRAFSWLVAEGGQDESVTGYDRSGWETSIWVLHAMWELPSQQDIPSVDEVRQRRIREGKLAPTVVGGINLDAVTVDTGIPLGFVDEPGDEWRRLPWAELSRRLGLPLGIGQDVPPCFRWFPFGSWPANVQPPPEGSLDGTSLRALLQVLVEQSAAAGDTGCWAFYSPVAMGDFDRVAMFHGPLRAVPDLVDGRAATPATPSNFWPDDLSWFVYTDWDLLATKVSGSPQLIEALATCPDLETVVWP